MFLGSWERDLFDGEPRELISAKTNPKPISFGGIMLVNHTKRRAVRCVLREVCFAKCSFLAKNSENHVFQQQNHKVFKNIALILF